MAYEENLEYLQRYQREQRKQKLLELEVEQLQSEAERVTSLLTGVPGGGSNLNRIPRAVEKILDTKQELQTQVEVCLKARKEITASIEKVEDRQRQEVLCRRYILGQKWERISEDMCLDYRWTLRVHKKAVEQLTIKSH